MKLDNETLRKLQLAELQLLKEIDRICSKLDIKYNIIAGTMLGAIRHKGFIPWDDDADVAMLRPEYERFRIACETELDKNKFYFQDQRNTVGYRWGYGKLRLKNTLFLREHQESMPYEQGIFLDVFPMDNIPDNYFLRTLHNFHCYCIRKIFWSEIGKKADKNFIKRVVYFFLSKIPEKTIKNYYWRFIKRGNKKETENVRMLMFPSPTKDYGYSREWYEDRALYDFEGLRFPGAKDYDAYLIRCYGDYMKLPPVEKRKVHPVSDIKVPDFGV
ncbi:MAG: LicD family protein [Treponema sp.]|nr:LicD family protein [Treponema sp.]